MELSGAEPVHSLNHRSCVFNGSLRQDAVAKIENMSGTIARTTQIPLDSHIMTKKRPGISQIRAPIHPYNIATRLLHQGKERGVAGSKMDGRNLLVNALEYALAVRIHIFLVVRRAECSDPTVKQLHGLHPSLNLKVQVGDYRVRDLVHESVPNVRSPVHESLGIDIVLRPSTLDHVAGKGEWCTRKPNQRSAPLQFLPHPLDSLLEEWHTFLGLQRKERIHILYRAHGIAYDRTFSFSKRQIHPHARKRQQDVCKDDGRVKVESPHGLEGDLSGEFRSPAHLQERAVSPQGPVLLQVPPCLSHHPNWRTVYLFPPAGLEEPVILRHQHPFVTPERVSSGKWSTASQRISERANGNTIHTGAEGENLLNADRKVLQ